jgi:hypothetical protein
MIKIIITDYVVPIIVGTIIAVITAFIIVKLGLWLL